MIHTSAIVEHNIQQYRFLSYDHFTNNYIFDFNYSLYCNIQKCIYMKNEKKRKKSMKLYNISILSIQCTCM